MVSILVRHMSSLEVPQFGTMVDCAPVLDRGLEHVALPVAYSMLYSEAFEGPAQFAHQSGG